MSNENGNLVSAVLFVVLVFVCLFVMELLHYDFSRISNDHPRKIVLIYDSPISESDTTWPPQLDTAFVDTVSVDKIVMSLDSIHLAVDSSAQDSLDSYFVETPSEANNEINRPKLITAKRKLPVIRYYKKENDGNRIYELRKFGYYIHERQSIGLKGFSSNAIFYGDKVSNKDIFTVANHLMEQGLELKTIEKSRYHAGWKSEAIEIGTDTTRLNAQSISKAEIVQKWGDN